MVDPNDGAPPESRPPQLARKYHRFAAADADLHNLSALNAAGVLDVLLSTPARPPSRSPCQIAHLRALASRIGEISGLADLVSLCRSLNREGARYVVIGGMAMIQAGFVRATEDIDLLVDCGTETI